MMLLQIAEMLSYRQQIQQCLHLLIVTTLRPTTRGATAPRCVRNHYLRGILIYSYGHTRPLISLAHLVHDHLELGQPLPVYRTVE